MKRPSHIVNYKQSAGILTGIVAAIAILLSQSLYYTVAAQSLEDVQDTEQKASDDSSTKEVQLTASNDLLGSGGQVSLEEPLQFTITISFDDFSDFTSTCLEAVDYNTQFRTLFRTLISPNAP